MNTDMLTWNIDKMTELKFKILKDRNYKIPKEFYYMIDDELIIYIAEHETIDNDAMISLLRSVTTISDRNYKYTVISLIERGLPEFLYGLNVYRVIPYVTEREYADSVIVPWLSVYFKKQEYNIPEKLISTYLKLKLSKFLRPWYTLTNRLIITEIRTLISEISNYSGIGEDIIITKILPIVYGVVQFRYMDSSRYDIRDVIITRDTYYDAGGNYISIYSGASSIISFLRNYIRRGFTFPIDITLCTDMLYYYNEICDCLVGGLSELQKLLIKTVRLNPNNLRLLKYPWYVTNSVDISQVVDTLLSSKIAIDDYSLISNFFSTIPNRYGDFSETLHTIIVHFLQIGMSYSSIIPYCSYDYIMDNLSLCVTYGKMEDIQSVILHPVFYNFRNDQSHGPKSIGDYIIEYVLPTVNYRTQLKVYEAILADEEVYKTIAKKNMNTIFDNIDIDRMLDTYPSIVAYENIQTYLNTAQIGNIHNTKILSYLPYSIVPQLSILKSAIINQGYLPLNYTATHKMTGSYVCGLLDRNVGYGYILDLPTKFQRNQVVSYYISNDNK